MRYGIFAAIVAFCWVFGALGQSRPAPPPPAGGTLVKVTSAADLQAKLQAVANVGGAIMFDPTTPVDVPDTIVVTLKDVGEFGPQFYFNGLVLNGTMRDGAKSVIRFAGKTRNMVIADLNIWGNRYATPGAKNGFELEAVDGDIWYFTLRRLAVSYTGADCINIKGSVFEGSIDQPITKDCWGNAMTIDGTPGVGGVPRVPSNIRITSADLSRSHGYGLELINANSVDLMSGSFILNGKGGVKSPRGIRYAGPINGENTGPALFDFTGLSPTEYPTTIMGANLSSDGKTYVGPPSRYLIMAPAVHPTIHLVTGYCTPYGGMPTMAVWAPAP